MDSSKPDPARFTSQILPGITERNERSSATISLIQEWLPVDARAVSRWALELPLEEDRAIAAPTLAAYWVRRDPAATMAWAKGIEEPAVRDAVAENITIGLASMDKKEATQWVCWRRREKGPVLAAMMGPGAAVGQTGTYPAGGAAWSVPASSAA